MRSCEGRVCVGMARGVSRGEKNACHTRAVAALRSRLAHRPRAWGNPLCVRHTARRTLRGVQLVGQGLGAGCGREGSPHALRGQSLPPPHPRVCACDRRAGGGRALESKRCVVAAQPQVCGRGVNSGRKSSNWSSRAKPTIPSRGTPAQRRARSGSEDRRPRKRLRRIHATRLGDENRRPHQKKRASCALIRQKIDPSRRRDEFF